MFHPLFHATLKRRQDTPGNVRENFGIFAEIIGKHGRIILYKSVPPVKN